VRAAAIVVASPASAAPARPPSPLYYETYTVSASAAICAGDLP
jgi:hypothetical protein